LVVSVVNVLEWEIPTDANVKAKKTCKENKYLNIVWNYILSFWSSKILGRKLKEI
jgi:hypothetical protein